MLQVECDTCKRKFWVHGHTTPDGWTDPGEIVTELKCEDELCQCLQAGDAYSVVDESYEMFGDEVI